LITDGEDGVRHYHRSYGTAEVDAVYQHELLIPYLLNSIVADVEFVKYWIDEIKGEIIMAKRTKTVVRKFAFKDTESQQAREEMVTELRALLEQLRAEDSELQFKKLTIRYTDGAVDEYVACNEPCLIMQELAE
jgi:hypothetical protein